MCVCPLIPAASHIGITKERYQRILRNTGPVEESVDSLAQTRETAQIYGSRIRIIIESWQKFFESWQKFSSYNIQLAALSLSLPLSLPPIPPLPLPPSPSPSPSPSLPPRSSPPIHSSWPQNTRYGYICSEGRSESLSEVS